MAHPSRELGWYLVAIPGALLYSLSRQIIDANILDFLDKHRHLRGKRYADIAAGFGIFTVQVAMRGVGEVVALDSNPFMNWRTRRRAQKYGVADKVKVINADMYGGLAKVINGPYDVINFGSCLYHSEIDVCTLLQEARELLAPGGFLTIKHPERNFARYARGRSGSIRIDHVLKYGINLLGDKLGLARWQPRSEQELYDIIHTAAGDNSLTWIDSPTPAYNVVAVQKPKA